MKNKYPANCAECGIRVETGAGEASRNDRGGWSVRCAECLGTQGQQDTAVRTLERVQDAITPAGTYTLLSGHAASAYQAAVFDHFKYGKGSAIIKAVAGAGKTTTIKNVVRFLKPWMHAQLFAFNTEAAGQLKGAIVELEEKGELAQGHHISAGTFHSVGFNAIRRKLGVSADVLKSKTDDQKVRKLLKARLDEDTFRTYGAFAASLVGFAKGEGIGALVPDLEERWYDLIEHHGMYLDDEEASIETAVGIARKALGWSSEAALDGSIDFDDMLYLVVLWKLRLWQNHVVVCDEAQDTSPVHRAMLRLALSPGGRLYAVGDPKQAIYGFTGASNDAMDRIAAEFNTRELPLTVSYRCARAVVERAQSWVPYIESHDAAAEGSVLDDVPLHAALGVLTHQDAILCRQTAPLVTVAYGLIARGRACRIMGREIGEGLVNLVENQKARGIERLIEKLEIWKSREMARFIAKGDERRAEGVADRANCLLVIIEALSEPERTVPALISRIRSLFDDRKDANVLTLATVHKAKGQEWPTVAILRPELMPSRGARQDWQISQEFNLMYVAATRAKNELIYVAAEDMAINAPKGRE